MNVFYEFYRILQHLQDEHVEYALIGGVAVAFYTTPRFTKDIDFLVRETALSKVEQALAQEGYFQSISPWTFTDAKLTLYRFMKIKDDDEMIVDVLVSGDQRHDQIIVDALEAESDALGVVRVASKLDLIWLKQQRNSKQDQADIERLTDEET